MSIAEEHNATAIIERQLGTLHAQVVPQDATNRAIVIGAVVGELHRIGSRMVADAFEEESWRVIYLGEDVPVDELVQSVRDVQSDVIGLSAQHTAHIPGVKLAIIALKRAGLGAIPVLVGGLPFVEEPELADEVGASGTARDAADAIRVANHLVQERARTLLPRPEPAPVHDDAR